MYNALAVNHAMAIHQPERSPVAQAERALLSFKLLYKIEDFG
ncbi:hypothetical protein [Scytonema hofmannii]|nr:hypothetical protein [Scytonema hofmannii]